MAKVDVFINTSKQNTKVSRKKTQNKNNGGNSEKIAENLERWIQIFNRAEKKGSNYGKDMTSV